MKYTIRTTSRFDREFAPIKNKTGVDSVDTARALLKENGVEL